MNALADAVAVTLGPEGRAVLLSGAGAPRLTRDGVAVAIAISLADPLENLGAELLRTIASETVAHVGDGTTTAIVLARAMAARTVELLAAGCDASELGRGLDEALAAARAALVVQRGVLEPRDVACVAALSAGGDSEAGELLSRAFAEVGADGLVAIEPGQGAESTLASSAGASFERGLLSPYFITNPERAECVLAEARVLVAHGPLSALEPLLPVLEAVRAAEQPLLVVAEDVLGDALAALAVNAARGTLRCAAVRSPGFGSGRREHSRDLAVLTGATVVGDESGVTLAEVGLQQLGTVERAIVTASSTTLIGGAGDAAALRARRESAQRALAAARDDPEKSESERIALQARVRQLTSGAAIVRVGGRTRLELADRTDRLEDALAALRAAFVEGVVPGGGVALLRCEEAVGRLTASGASRAAGHGIVRHALAAPLRRLLLNANHDAAAIVERLRRADGAAGFDVVRGAYGDLRQWGILDPLAVVRSALDCAGRFAGLLLTTGASLLGADAEIDDFRDV